MDESDYHYEKLWAKPDTSPVCDTCGHRERFHKNNKWACDDITYIPTNAVMVGGKIECKCKKFVPWGTPKPVTNKRDPKNKKTWKKCKYCSNLMNPIYDPQDIYTDCGQCGR